MRQHKPEAVLINNEKMTQLTLIPTWSQDERECRNCHQIIAPVIGDFQIGMQAYKPAADKRIQLADATALAKLKVAG